MMAHNAENAEEPPHLRRMLMWQRLAFGLVHDHMQPLSLLTVPYTERRRCGRWLMVQRTRHGFCDSTLAAQGGIAPELVVLLELGLAEQANADDDQWQQTAILLADDRHDPELVMAIIYVACGEPTAATASVLTVVTHDLEVLHSQHSERATSNDTH